uniref:3-isopropylmalate dehydrogenase n=1 Tax=Rhizophora mucronata TaxID=61149 RepID=A0A2P2MVZ6_RHIMU
MVLRGSIDLSIEANLLTIIISAKASWLSKIDTSSKLPYHHHINTFSNILLQSGSIH